MSVISIACAMKRDEAGHADVDAQTAQSWPSCGCPYTMYGHVRQNPLYQRRRRASTRNLIVLQIEGNSIQWTSFEALQDQDQLQLLYTKSTHMADHNKLG